MSEKNIKSRIVHKHDIESNWLLATNFIPKQGELIVYDIDDNYDYERFKIGDGATVVSALPFADDNKADVAHTHDSLKGGIINISAEQNLGGVRIYRDGGSTNGAFYLKPANNTYASNQSITIENGSNAVSNGAFLKFQGSSSDNVRIGGVKTPTDDNDAANKAYVDANKTVVDNALSDTSTNAVQNKVVNSAIANLQALIGDTSVANQITAAIQAMLPKVTTIILGTNWTGTASPYYQDIALSCVTDTSVVDLQPTPTQLADWQDAGLAFTTQSGDGTVRVYVAGSKPTAEISVQVKVQEVVQV